MFTSKECIRKRQCFHVRFRSAQHSGTFCMRFFWFVPFKPKSFYFSFQFLLLLHLHTDVPRSSINPIFSIDNFFFHYSTWNSTLFALLTFLLLEISSWIELASVHFLIPGYFSTTICTGWKKKSQTVKPKVQKVECCKADATNFIWAKFVQRFVLKYSMRFRTGKRWIL